MRRVRHGIGPYDAGVSDLQCPATLLVLGRDGWPTHVPEPQEQNVTVVYCPADEIGVAAELADRLDAALRPVHDLIGPVGVPNAKAAPASNGPTAGDRHEGPESNGPTARDRHEAPAANEPHETAGAGSGNGWGGAPGGDEAAAPGLDEGAGWSALHRALGDIADLHRGETVVVFTPTREPGRQIRIDADGWAVTRLDEA